VGWVERSETHPLRFQTGFIDSTLTPYRRCRGSSPRAASTHREPGTVIEIETKDKVTQLRAAG